MAQSLARLWTHLIFSTKNRFHFLNDKKLRTDMHAYLANVLRQQDCDTLIVNGVGDHIHALLHIPSRQS
jgi:REP element-mobilizing transposase RayT